MCTCSGAALGRQLAIHGTSWEPLGGQIAVVRSSNSIALRNAIVRLVRPLTQSCWQCLVLRTSPQLEWIGHVTINCHIWHLEYAWWANTSVVRTYRWHAWNSQGLLHLLANGIFRGDPAPGCLRLEFEMSELGMWKSHNGTLVLYGPGGNLLFGRLEVEHGLFELLNADCAEKWIVLLSSN